MAKEKRAAKQNGKKATVVEKSYMLAEDSRTMADEIRQEMDVLLQESQDAVIMATEVQKGNDAHICVDANVVVSDAMDSLSAISEENAASSEETGAAMEERETCNDAGFPLCYFKVGEGCV